MLSKPVIAQVALAEKNVDTTRIEQIDHKARIFVESGRPLASAALELATKYGWQINYEDPPFLDIQDLHDVTALVSRDPFPKHRDIVPKGGTLEAEFSLSDGKPENPAAILQSLIEAHHQKGNPGLFRLKQSGSVLTIIPTAVKNKKGQLVAQKSLMGTRVSLPIQEGTMMEIATAIMQAVTKSSGTRVGLFTVPLNFFHQTKVRLNTPSGTARDLLQNTLDASGWKLAWQLRCDPILCGLSAFFVPSK
jgi:hypothetical protein